MPTETIPETKSPKKYVGKEALADLIGYDTDIPVPDLNIPMTTKLRKFMIGMGYLSVEGAATLTVNELQRRGEFTDSICSELLELFDERGLRHKIPSNYFVVRTTDPIR